MVIALCILALLAAFLISPLNIFVSYNDSILRVKAGVGVCMFTVYNSSKPKKRNKKKEPAVAESKTEKPKNKLTLEKIKEIFTLFFDILKFLKKHLVFYEFTAKLCLGFESAAQTGIMTGTAWGILYNIAGFIDRTFVLKKYCVDVIPDFENEKLDFIFECGARLRAFWVLSMLFVLLKNIKRIRKVM